MKKNRVGIITHYYGNLNYGANLQAFALIEFLNEAGVHAEQIAYNFNGFVKSDYKSILIKKAIWLIKNCFRPKKLLRRLRYNIEKTLIGKSDANNENVLRRDFLKRYKAIIRFNENLIPHSKVVYNDENIESCVLKYDSFITGSDQVWCDEIPPFFLSFVADNKKKISYAASISRTMLSDEQKSFFTYHLDKFDSISVREKSDVELLSGFLSKDVKWVLDPTMLLTSEQWMQYIKKVSIKEKYVFCYFLGDNKRIKDLAKQYATKNGLSLVVIPHFINNCNSFLKNDIEFGDYQLFDVDPFDFISLINGADCIFTDSFHGMVFCTLFKKDFFVFPRDGRENMNTRFETLASIFNCNSRLCFENKKININYLTSQGKIVYKEKNVMFETKRNESIVFLEKSLNL